MLRILKLIQIRKKYLTLQLQSSFTTDIFAKKQFKASYIWCSERDIMMSPTNLVILSKRGMRYRFRFPSASKNLIVIRERHVLSLFNAKVIEAFRMVCLWFSFFCSIVSSIFITSYCFLVKVLGYFIKKPNQTLSWTSSIKCLAAHVKVNWMCLNIQKLECISTSFSRFW